MVIAKDLPREGIRAAAFRVALHHIGVVFTDDQHDDGTDHHTQRAAKRPRLRQIGIGRHHQGSPAYARAQGKGPGAGRGQARLQLRLLFFRHIGTCPFVVFLRGFVLL